MKILCIVSSSIAGGATFSLLNTLNGLKSKGRDILVITPEEGFLCGELKKLQIPYTIEPIVFSVRPPLNSVKDIIKFIPRLIKNRVKYFIAFSHISKIIGNWKPDIIYTNVSVVDIGYNLAKRHNLPHLWHIREYSDKDFDWIYLPSISKYRRKLNDSFSISITNDLKKYHQLGDKCKVIYNGIEDTGALSGKNISSNKIIFVGRLTPNKGALEVIESFAKVAYKTNYSLEFWGSCQEQFKLELEQLIRDKGLEKRVSLKGPTNNVYSVMQNSRAIIVASKSEGFGRITAEAMQNGCLVIGKDTAGTKEQFDNGKQMTNEEIALRYNDGDSLSDAILRLSNMPENYYLTITRNAKKVVGHLYSVQKNVAEIDNYILSILEGKK